MGESPLSILGSVATSHGREGSHLGVQPGTGLKDERPLPVGADAVPLWCW